MQNVPTVNQTRRPGRALRLGAAAAVFAVTAVACGGTPAGNSTTTTSPITVPAPDVTTTTVPVDGYQPPPTGTGSYNREDPATPDLSHLGTRESDSECDRALTAAENLIEEVLDADAVTDPQLEQIVAQTDIAFDICPPQPYLDFQSRWLDPLRRLIDTTPADTTPTDTTP